MLIFDSKDTFYLIARAAFFGLTILPILYVAAGTVIGLLAAGLPFVDPLLGATTRLAVEHLTDQIVTWRLPVQASPWTGLPYRQSGGSTWLLLLGVMLMTIALVEVAGMALTDPPASPGKQDCTARRHGWLW